MGQPVFAGQQQFSVLLSGGSWGADFLMRTHIPFGSFIRSIRRNEDLNHMDIIKGTRTIGFDYHNSSDQFSEAETKDSEIVDDTYYETSLRSGGALAIAALASASTHETISEDYSSQDYLKAAEEAYEYLVENNNLYTNDGKWNFVDYYTVLLASTELYLSTKDEKYLLDSRDGGQLYFQWYHRFFEGLCGVDVRGVGLAIHPHGELHPLYPSQYGYVG